MIQQILLALSPQSAQVTAYTKGLPQKISKNLWDPDRNCEGYTLQMDVWGLESIPVNPRHKSQLQRP